jgi:hypothetical protein
MPDSIAETNDSPTICRHCSRPIHMATVAWVHDGGTIYCDSPTTASPVLPGMQGAKRYELTAGEAEFVAMVLMNWGADRAQCIRLAERLESGR